MANEKRTSLRKVRTGKVVSDKNDKSITVLVERKMKHPRYEKTFLTTKKIMAHDENNDAHAGDVVRVMETRPLSKLKRWRLVEVVERAK